MNATNAAVPREEFVLGGRIVFDVTAAKELVSDGRKPVEFRVPDLMGALNFLGVDPEHAAALPDAALTEPLIFAKTETGRWQIIDGLHRIHAAHDRGHDTLPVVTLTREESVKVQTGEAKI